MKGPRRENWSVAEEDLLRRLATSGASVREISERISRTESAIGNRMKRLGISRARKIRKWTRADEDSLKKLHGERLLLTEIAERMGRGHTAVAAKARALGLHRYLPPPDADNLEPATETRPSRPFSEMERRRVAAFLRRGDTIVDVARQMRCDVEDVRRIKGFANELPRGDCGGAGARCQPKTTTTAVPRHNFFRESIL